jgi:hypothetical protein
MKASPVRLIITLVIFILGMGVATSDYNGLELEDFLSLTFLS